MMILTWDNNHKAIKYLQNSRCLYIFYITVFRTSKDTDVKETIYGCNSRLRRGNSLNLLEYTVTFIWSMRDFEYKSKQTTK